MTPNRAWTATRRGFAARPVRPVRLTRPTRLHQVAETAAALSFGNAVMSRVFARHLTQVKPVVPDWPGLADQDCL